MSSNLNKLPGSGENQDNPEAEKWSTLSENGDRPLTEAERQATIEKYAAGEKARATDEIRYHTRYMTDLEHQFKSKLDQNNGSPLDKKEFLAWEDELADEWRKVEKQAYSAKLNLFEQADAMRPIVAYPPDTEEISTIEAQAGRYFRERSRLLASAIENANRNTMEKDMDTLGSFQTAVTDHLYFKYNEVKFKSFYGEKEYEAKRTMRHNKVIDSLNNLNILAKSYGTRPFTPRNFWASNLIPKDNQSDPMKDKMRYDRDVVSKYYVVAFGKDVDFLENDLKSRLEGFRDTE